MKKKKIIWSDIWFYVAVLAIPVFKYVFDHVFINFNSILMAFQKVNIDTGKLEFAGFENFAEILDLVFHTEQLKLSLWRSIWAYLVTLVVTTVIPVFLVYYVWKRFWLSEFFKVVLFLPSVVSSIITMTIFRFLANRLAPEIVYNLFGKEIMGLTSNPDTSFGAILVYSLWMSLGGGLLTMLGSMNAIDNEIIEAGVIDGTNAFTEFWHIVLPGIYRIVSIGFITGIISIFTADYGLYGFYGSGADPQTWTIGYYFNARTIEAQTSQLPLYASWGILLSAIAIPLTLTARYLIYNKGPREEDEKEKL